MTCILTSSKVLHRVLDDEAKVSRPRRCMLHGRVWNIVGRMQADLLTTELESKAFFASTLMTKAHKFHVQYIPVEGHRLVQIRECHDKMIKPTNFRDVYNSLYTLVKAFPFIGHS